jgi:hypothetical protein
MPARFVGGSGGGGKSYSFTYSISNPALTTSAAVYDSNGVLQRTLWSGVATTAGTHTGYWAGDNDFGAPATGAPFFHARVLSHNVTYTWEGVIGNLSNSFTGSAVMASLGWALGVSISGTNLWVTVGYNEGGQCVAEFALSTPNTRAGGMLLDFGIAPIQIATDTSNLYWASCGGASTKRFVAVNALSTGNNVALSSGTNITPESITYSAIDIYDHAVNASATATGISVSSSYIAVAHGGLGTVLLFNKTTGASVNSISVSSMAYVDGVTTNQLAFDPSGNLWVISGTSVIEYTNPSVNSNTGTTITGFSNPLAVATDSSGNVWVADGGTAQQVLKYNSAGVLQSTFGSAGGYATSPAVATSKFIFYTPDATGNQQTALCVDSSGGVWVIDTGNQRILHFTSSAVNDATMQWWSKLYASTVDHASPGRVFLNFCEFSVDYTQTLTAGPSQTAWSMVNNWLAGNPSGPSGGGLSNGWAGFTAVETLNNGRTYATAALASGVIGVYELPSSGLLRQCTTFAAPPAGTSSKAMMEDGTLAYVSISGTTQTFYRQTLTGFDGSNNPIWGAATAIATVQTSPDQPAAANTPYCRIGTFSGNSPYRFPISQSGNIICFDQTSDQGRAGISNEGYHLGAVPNGGTAYLWLASHTGPLGKGAFQTHAVDHSMGFAANELWTYNRHVFFGFHGEFFTDLTYNQVGEANQFMHFYDDGLFIGQFGVENIAHFNTGPSLAGIAGNSFSPTYAFANSTLYWYNNDESQHGGLHRWRIDGISTISEQDIAL